MSELISNIFSKYGLSSLIGMLIAIIIIWAAAHYMSAPGGKVSVIWGLVEYTKPQNKLIQSNSVTVSMPQKKIAKNTESLPASKPSVAVSMPQKKIAKNTESLPASKPKETITIFFRNLQKSDLESELQGLRNRNSLRSLASLETGKKIGETPRGTYFFTLYAWLNIDNGIYEEEIQRYEARSFSAITELEIHHSTEGEFYLVGFVSETHAAEISQLSGLNKKKVTFSATWHPKFSTLVRLPASRILVSSDRTLDMSEGKLGVLDIELQ